LLCHSGNTEEKSIHPTPAPYGCQLPITLTVLFVAVGVFAVIMKKSAAAAGGGTLSGKPLGRHRLRKRAIQ